MFTRAAIFESEYLGIKSPSRRISWLFFEARARASYLDRIVGADSGQSALEIVRQLKLRGDVVSLFLVDQRMPRMTGVEFLAKGIKDFPWAKRVLLTAYSDKKAAINAINEVQIDHYLTKPSDPPEERLYPVVGSFHFHRCNAAHRLRRRSD